MPMRLAPVVPWKRGPVMPVGMSPATTCHWTGVGVAPVLKVVSQPVVAKSTTELVLAMTVGGADCVVMTQLPVGAAGEVTGVTVGVQPERVTVSIGVRPESETVTL